MTYFAPTPPAVRPLLVPQPELVDPETEVASRDTGGARPRATPYPFCVATAGAGFLTLEEAARVAGHARWVEDRLFATVGEWVAVEDDPAAKSLFSAHSLRHAWHASIWRDRIPRVAHLDPDALTVPAGPGVAARMDELAAAAASGADGTLERLTLVTGVLSDLVAEYRDRIARAHPLADGPTVRWLRFVVADEVSVLEELAAVAEGRSGVVRARKHRVGAGDWLGLAKRTGA